MENTWLCENGIGKKMDRMVISVNEIFFAASLWFLSLVKVAKMKATFFNKIEHYGSLKLSVGGRITEQEKAAEL